MTLALALPERLASKIGEPDENGCWPWLRATNQGYGIYTITPKTPRHAHRVVYELLVGPVPDGLDLDHLCRVRHCVNPDHLEPVTRGENVRRGFRSRGLATHCKYGHEWSPENTYVRPKDGSRDCRSCKRRNRHPRRSAG